MRLNNPFNRKFLRDTDGVAAVEMALILPVLVALLLGVVDAGNLLLLHKKVLMASQITGDLVTRNRTISAAQISDSIAAARMAIQPFPTAPLGVDIVSIQFVGTTATPTVLWRETQNMAPNANALTLAAGLGVQNEGVVITTTSYQFTPIFLGSLVGARNIKEVSVTRGRRAPLVNKSG